ncbi:type IX secretion system plug protein [Mangrovimonas aestuarii]|uniref:type IX secretion system plug protein n=1 Tax=Mangrovimonas aestuarii TaxID=3018443 RepID=UPI002377E05E|nr:DUF5103 domain-containing protein [Mangrovimonas aestuarii]
MVNKFIALILFLFITTIGFSQAEQELAPPDYIKTIMFKGDTQESQLPILRLGEQVILEFDALNALEEDYYYKIEHYNFDWTPSVLVKSEYIDGYDNQRLRNYINSVNSYQIYSHYTLTIPNQYTRALRVSGNYMLKIFNEYDELVFSRKFMIYEPEAQVGVDIKRSRDVKYVDEKQSVDIRINSATIQFVNPQQTIKTLIVQNNNLNTAISNLKPMYTMGNELIYKYTNESSFWGGNEYLFFENKDVRVATNTIEFIDLQELYHNYLFTNVPRRNTPYTYNPDINGNFLVTAIDRDNPSTEADYVWIHFSLQLEKQPEDIYVYGNYNNYQLTEENRMEYNETKRRYEKKILLKQGFYNYKYVKFSKDGVLDEGAISGNYFQTENDYKVLVYYRRLGGRYDKLIGIGEGNSVDITN